MRVVSSLRNEPSVGRYLYSWRRAPLPCVTTRVGAADKKAIGVDADWVSLLSRDRYRHKEYPVPLCHFYRPFDPKRRRTFQAHIMDAAAMLIPEYCEKIGMRVPGADREVWWLDTTNSTAPHASLPSLRCLYFLILTASKHPCYPGTAT